MMQRYSATLFLCLVLALGACRSSSIEINVRYDRISGLTAQDRVIFEENDAGNVESIQYSRDGTYLVQLDINSGYANAVTEHALFFVVEDPNRAGHKAVEIRHLQSGGRLLSSGVSVDGAYEVDGISRLFQKEIESGLRFFKQTVDRLGQEIQGFAESKEYHEMKRSLEGLADEMARREKSAREAIKRQWLPRIQRELDDLREKLKALGRENEMAPLEEQMERLHHI